LRCVAAHRPPIASPAFPTRRSSDLIVGRDGDIVFTPEDRAAKAPQKEREEGRARGRAEDERWHVRKDSSRFWGLGAIMPLADGRDRKSTRLNSSHQIISYAVFCLKI